MPWVPILTYRINIFGKVVTSVLGFSLGGGGDRAVEEEWLDRI